MPGSAPAVPAGVGDGARGDLSLMPPRAWRGMNWRPMLLAHTIRFSPVLPSARSRDISLGADVEPPARIFFLSAPREPSQTTYLLVSALYGRHLISTRA